MRTLKKLTIHEADLSAQSLTRERMKFIKGGGGNCYVYCQSGGSSSMTITSSCGEEKKCAGRGYCECN